MKKQIIALFNLIIIICKTLKDACVFSIALWKNRKQWKRVCNGINKDLKRSQSINKYNFQEGGIVPNNFTGDIIKINNNDVLNLKQQKDLFDLVRIKPKQLRFDTYSGKFIKKDNDTIKIEINGEMAERIFERMKDVRIS